MSKSKQTEAQMIAALKQVEAGRKVEDVARENGVSKHTIYAWKAKYGGMDVSEPPFLPRTPRRLEKATRETIIPSLNRNRTIPPMKPAISTL
jgi:putative transposase